jgi:hypothetical protein
MTVKAKPPEEVANRSSESERTREDMRALTIPRTSYFVASTGQPRMRGPRGDILIATVGLLLVL